MTAPALRLDRDREIASEQREEMPARLTLSFARDLTPITAAVVEIRIPTRPALHLTRAEAFTFARRLAAFLQDTR